MIQAWQLRLGIWPKCGLLESSGPPKSYEEAACNNINVAFGESDEEKGGDQRKVEKEFVSSRLLRFRERSSFFYSS